MDPNPCSLFSNPCSLFSNPSLIRLQLADLGLANVDIQLGLMPETDLGAVIAGRSRLADSVETALKFGEGYIIVEDQSSDLPQDLFFSENLACPEHGVSLRRVVDLRRSFALRHASKNSLLLAVTGRVYSTLCMAPDARCTHRTRIRLTPRRILASRRRRERLDRA